MSRGENRLFRFRSRRDSNAVSEPPCPNPGEPVYVNVYNLHWPNGMKIGGYHTGTVVYGNEYGFGGHPFPVSGLFQIIPRDEEAMGEGFSFRETLYVGRTYLSLGGVERLLLSLQDEFQGNAYHLLKYNCNNFTADFIKLLCSATLPSWINMMERFVSSLGFVESLLPPYLVRPGLMRDEADPADFFRLIESEYSSEDSSKPVRPGCMRFICDGFSARSPLYGHDLP